MLRIFLVLVIGLLSSCATTGGKDKKYLWLEKVDSEKALDWSKKESQSSLAELSQEEGFLETKNSILKRLEDKDKLIYGRRVGKYFYNFWKDADSPRGVWRRSLYNSYVSGQKIQWETLLDVDALSKKEGKKWVFKGAIRFSDSASNCILRLSDGGKDAVHLREFSIAKKDFVSDGWNLPEAKYSVAVVDQDTLLVASNRDPDQVTRSNYPRLIKLLKKGQSLKEAKTVISIPKSHNGVWAYNIDVAPEKKIALISDSVDFFTSHNYIFENGHLKPLSMPKPVELEAYFQDKLFFSVKKDSQFGNQKMKSGSIYYLEKEEQGFSRPRLFFQQKNTQKVFKSLSSSKDHLVVTFQENVKKVVYRYTLSNDKWSAQKLKTQEEASVMDASFYDNEILLQETGFLSPSSIVLMNLKTEKRKTLQKQKSYFDESKFTYKQDWAKSADGTMIPFFVVHSKKLEKSGKNPTMMYGYGGFEISLQPFYLKNRGPEWLEKGGVFVLTNIRGGGEFGPQWHQAAQKFNKKKSYEDFAAIAKKLFAEKITSPEHLGIVGGSNGGLLVGASSVLYPELYGAVFCAVPLLDMLRYDRLLAGASWISEYGDPKIKEEKENLLTFSPFQNVKEDQEYPEILFYTSTFDDRVHPAHARKMYHKMKDQGHQVYYYENSEGGHAGSSNLEQRALMDALKFTFFQKVLM